jgi:Spy/CpxP family protein refolding chaperone
MMTKFAGNNMKRTAAVLLCSAVLALPALAQSGTTGSGAPDQMQGPPPGGPGGRRGGGPEQRLEMMQKELNLTPDQTAKVKTILEDGRKQMMDLRQSNASQEDRRARMMSLRETELASIRAVLTDDQKPKFEAMETRMREQMRGGRGNGDGPPPPPPSSTAPQS